jgi:hypothetical protein
LSDAYVKELARVAYLWAWPMVNLRNRLVAFEQVPEPGLMGGVMPVGPPNEIGMLRDYVTPDQKYVACPNQDVVYGFGILAPAREPVVVQVPDFGDRFWVYQLGDQRTDGFARLGAMYDSRPGCYLVVGADWDGEPPDGIEAVFRCPTEVGYLIPRIFMDDTEEDRAAVRPLVDQVMSYPLGQFTGEPRSHDWSSVPSFPPAGDSGDEEIQWVDPEAFFDVLPQVLDDVPPLPGEEALSGWVRSVLDAAAEDERVAALLKEAAVAANAELVQPLFEFDHVGIAVANGWTSPPHTAAFGTDYLTRTACAKSNIFVNQPQETAYFYLEADVDGEPLRGDSTYAVTFPAGELPPGKGFWSLTLYNEHHFFHPNELGRYSLGTKNRDLVFAADGSLTIFAQATPPGEDERANWLPAPDGKFELYLRAYWPGDRLLDGDWTPPVVTRLTAPR